MRAVTCEAAFFGPSVRREGKKEKPEGELLVSWSFLRSASRKAFWERTHLHLAPEHQHFYTLSSLLHLLSLCTWFSLQTAENKQRKNLLAAIHQVSPVPEKLHLVIKSSLMSVHLEARGSAMIIKSVHEFWFQLQICLILILYVCENRLQHFSLSDGLSFLLAFMARHHERLHEGSLSGCESL